MDNGTMAQALNVYHTARKAGRRYVNEMNGQNASGLLPVLEPLLEETCNEIPLGLIEIPLSKVRGTYASGRSSAFAGNFMPLLDSQTEFATKWMNLYISALSDGIRESVQVYEYIGYYYIIEGNKRVSVAKTLGGYAISAVAQRLMPPAFDNSKEYQIFREFLQEDNRRPVKHLWFSEPGRFTELRALRNAALDKDHSLPKDLIDDSFSSFRTAYHKIGYHKSLSDITTGDAFWQYVKIYGFPIHETEGALGANLRIALPQFRELYKAVPEQSLSEVTPESGARLPFLTLFNRNARLSVLFAYAGTPKTRFSAAVHDVGRYVTERRFPELRISTLEGLPTNGAVYPKLREALKNRSNTLVLATDATMGQAALRLSLELKSDFIMHCHHQSIGLLSTYYAKTEETAFLSGILAGSLSRDARIGYIRPTPALGCMEQDMQAFAQGVKMVRPNAQLYFTLPDKKQAFPIQSICRQWGAMGVDVVWMPFFPGFYDQRQTFFPGVYAYLCGIDKNGSISHQIAASAWHWGNFYGSLLDSILEGSPDALSVRAGRLHYRLGLTGGVLRVHPIQPVCSPRSELLLRHFSNLIAEERLNPVDEHMTVELMET